MAKAAIGALVKYCGHEGCFLADIYEIEGANVVRANGEVTPANIDRRKAAVAKATHHLRDFPKAGFWKPQIGVFVVPKDQVAELGA